MTKREFSELTGKSLASVRKLCEQGCFFVEGFGEFEAVKRGRGRTSPFDIRRVSSERSERSGGGLSLPELKARKLEAEIRHLEQRTLDRQETIERNFEVEIIDRLLDVLQPLKDAFVKCKLTSEQTSFISGALNESLRRLKELSDR